MATATQSGVRTGPPADGHVDGVSAWKERIACYAVLRTGSEFNPYKTQSIPKPYTILNHFSKTTDDINMYQPSDHSLLRGVTVGITIKQSTKMTLQGGPCPVISLFIIPTLW